MSIFNFKDIVSNLEKLDNNKLSDFSISFVSPEEHKARYDNTVDYKISDSFILNLDLDENDNVLSIEFIDFSK